MQAILPSNHLAHPLSKRPHGGREKALVRIEQCDGYRGRLADGLRIVQKGLNPGDSVIVDGLQKVFMPGMPVNAKTVAMTSSATLN